MVTYWPKFPQDRGRKVESRGLVTESAPQSQCVANTLWAQSNRSSHTDCHFPNQTAATRIEQLRRVTERQDGYGDKVTTALEGRGRNHSRLWIPHRRRSSRKWRMGPSIVGQLKKIQTRQLGRRLSRLTTSRPKDREGRAAHLACAGPIGGRREEAAGRSD